MYKKSRSTSPRANQSHRAQQPRSSQHKQPANKQDTSWDNSSTWYNKIVGSSGHYYHEHVVLPGTLKLLQLKPDNSLVDLGCGQGVLARAIPPVSEYLGIDLAPNLIEQARRQNKKSNYDFITRDVSRPIHGAEPQFTHATIILALQNMAHPQTALQNAAKYLHPGGKLVIVLNHPCFRIPRQSGWETNPKDKQQFRWMNRYLSALKIPITMHPGKTNGRRSPQKAQENNVTWSFHHSLQDYSEMLQNTGFVIERIEEWTSDKESEGKAKSENRARAEFPLFMAIRAKKTMD